MKFRRMRRTAELKDIVTTLDEYKSELIKKHKDIENEFDNRRNAIDTEVRNFEKENSKPNAQKVKQSIVNIINGDGTFPGLSELPETENYANYFNVILDEYNKIKVKRPNSNEVMSDLSSGEHNYTDRLNKLKENNIEAAFSQFIKALANAYSTQYADGWKPLEKAVLDLKNDFVVNFNQFSKLFGGIFRGNTVKENFGRLFNSLNKRLNKDMSDFNYYAQEFKTVYASGFQPRTEEEKKSMEAWDNLTSLLLLDVTRMREAYDWLVDYNDVVEQSNAPTATDSTAPTATGA